MKAAVVTSFDSPPRYADFDAPSPAADEILVATKAAAVTQLARIFASGKHPAAGKPPFVPGTDGVGVVEGKRMYFAFPRPPVGSMAELVAVKRRYVVPVPDDLDDVTAAATANPGMAAWSGLTRRARFVRGESVLVNGAAGTSGRIAVQVAKYLGARRVVATARNPDVEGELRALGADALIVLTQNQAELTEAFKRELRDHGVDVMLDYLYGNTAEAFLQACTGPGRGDAEPRVRFVQLGTLAGPNVTLPAGVLRSSGLELLGSGLGALSHEELVKGIGEFMAVFRAAGFRIETEAAALRDVESAWARETSARVVLTI
ncbi:MAG TPA: zinc-binding alcohol dehydrogenase family protein [Polyangiaceae bacterium]|nr:zinc-binding alcohol dehydrogenase family protein [Polyangiaceae bacterium]